MHHSQPAAARMLRGGSCRWIAINCSLAAPSAATHAENRLHTEGARLNQPSVWICRCTQVSFYRDNLHFSVVPKQYGQTEDGKPLPLESLAVFIRRAAALPSPKNLLYMLFGSMYCRCTAGFFQLELFEPPGSLVDCLHVVAPACPLPPCRFCTQATHAKLACQQQPGPALLRLWRRTRASPGGVSSMASASLTLGRRR